MKHYILPNILVLIVVTLVGIVWFQSDDRTNNTLAGTNTSVPLGIDVKLAKVEQDIIVIADVTQPVEQPRTTSATLYNYFDKNQVPYSQLTKFVIDFFGSNNDDSDGLSSLVIARALQQCDSMAAENILQLEQIQQQFEQAVLSSGGNNGDILEGFAYHEQQFVDCKLLIQLVGSNDSYGYLEYSASQANAAAQVELATEVLPADFTHWDLAQQSQYKAHMGQLILAAQSQCELRAFQALANPNGFGEGTRWSYPVASDMPLAVQTYGNLLASTLYVAERLRDADRLVAFNRTVMAERSAEMTVAELELATRYGESLYSNYCI